MLCTVAKGGNAHARALSGFLILHQAAVILRHEGE